MNFKLKILTAKSIIKIINNYSDLLKKLSHFEVKNEFYENLYKELRNLKIIEEINQNSSKKRKFSDFIAELDDIYLTINQKLKLDLINNLLENQDLCDAKTINENEIGEQVKKNKKLVLILENLINEYHDSNINLKSSNQLSSIESNSNQLSSSIGSCSNQLSSSIGSCSNQLSFKPNSDKLPIKLNSDKLPLYIEPNSKKPRLKRPRIIPIKEAKPSSTIDDLSSNNLGFDAAEIEIDLTLPEISNIDLTTSIDATQMLSNLATTSSIDTTQMLSNLATTSSIDTTQMVSNLATTSNLTTTSLNKKRKITSSNKKRQIASNKKTKIASPNKIQTTLPNSIEEFTFEFKLDNINEFLQKNDDQNYSPMFGDIRKWCIEVYSSPQSTNLNIGDNMKYLAVGLDLFKLSDEDIKRKARKTIYCNAEISIINQLEPDLNVECFFDYCDFKLSNYNKKGKARDIKVDEKFVNYEKIREQGFIFDDKLSFMIKLKSAYSKSDCEF